MHDLVPKRSLTQRVGIFLLALPFGIFATLFFARIPRAGPILPVIFVAGLSGSYLVLE